MKHAWMQQIADTSYPAVQLGLATEFRGLHDSEIEDLVDHYLPGSSAEEVENFMRSLRSFGKAAAPVAQRALPGVIQGATTGAAAGPWGALIGGVVGGTASALSGGGGGGGRGGQAPQRTTPSPASQPIAPRTNAPLPATPQSRPPSRPPQTPRTLSSTPARTVARAPARLPRASAAGMGGDDAVVSATARVLLLLARPEVQNALLSLLMGGAGRRQIRRGGASMPVEQLAEALAEASADLASAARQASHQSMEQMR